MLKKLWQAETWIFLGLFTGLLWIGQRQFLFDPGCFWSTVLGQRILTTHDVPRQEEFSWTHQGMSWQSHQWMAQVGMAGLHAIGGLDALVLGSAVLLAATYAWAVGRMIHAGCNWVVTACVLLLLLWASQHHWLARPQLATIALLGWSFAQLINVESGQASWRRLAWLPPTFVLWTNLHGGALGGLCTLAFVFAGWCACWLVRWPGPVKSVTDLGKLAMIGIACVLATLVNPYGLELPLGWIRLMGQNTLSKYVYEHMPLDWENPYQRGILVFGFFYILVLATVPLRRWRITWLVPVVWFLLTLQRVRHCTLFSITAVIALAEVLPNSLLADWRRKAMQEAAQREGRITETSTGGPSTRGSPWAWAIPAAIVAFALALQACGISFPLLGARQAQLDPALAPTELIDAIRQRSKPNDLIFNEMAYGGFLIYYLPELRIYIDDRCELYGDDFITKQLELSALFSRMKHEHKDPSTHDQLERLADEKRFRLALVLKSGGLDYYFSNMPDRWTRVGETVGHISPASVPGAVLYERKP